MNIHFPQKSLRIRLLMIIALALIIFTILGYYHSHNNTQETHHPNQSSSSAKSLKESGQTAQQLRANGFSAKSLLNAGFEKAQLSQAGYSNIEIERAMKTVYFHIGFPKTGTSILQNTITHNAALIENELGLKRLSTGSSLQHKNSENGAWESANYNLFFFFTNGTLFNSYKQKKDFQSVWSDLILEIDQSNQQHFFVTCELMALQTKEDERIAKIYDYLKAYNVKIVIVTRDSQDLYPSFYKQTLYDGWQKKSAKEFLSDIGKDLGYSVVAKRWAKHFGIENIILMKYNDIKGNTITSTFLSKLGFNHQLALAIPPNQKKPSLVLDKAAIDFALHLTQRKIPVTELVSVLRQISDLNVAYAIQEDFLDEQDIMKLKKIDELDQKYSSIHSNLIQKTTS